MNNNENIAAPQWDLSDLYKSSDDKQIEIDLKNVANRAKRFQSIFKDKLKEADGNVLGNAITEYEAIEEILGKLNSYAYLFYAENMSDERRSSFYQGLTEKINEISLTTLFFTIEINKIDDSELEKKLASSEVLQKYAPWLYNIREYKDHMLLDDMEKLIHEKDITARAAWQRLFDETIADLKVVVKGKSINLTKAINMLSSTDGKIRKISALAITKALTDKIKTFTIITNTLAKDKDINDKWRKFSSPISARNLSNHIEDEIVTTLIETVKENYPKLSHRYYKIKAKWLGKKKLEFWDRNAPLPGKQENLISWEEAKNLVLSAYSDFCPQMASIAEKFFDNNWIDAYVRDGKDSGAFSHPTIPSVHPYILMNFQGKTRDIMTLAHELGHGIHQILAAKQGVLLADTPLTLAETASVFGEQLSFRKMLANNNDAKQKKIMLAEKIEDMLNTVVRQIAFCEFEQEIHAKRKDSELTTSEINKIWLSVQQKSLGEYINLTKEYACFWTYIPHFIHSPFYVYSYAFGDCLVNSLYRLYQQQPDGFVEKYITMLEAGGTLRHKELLAPFSLDASKKDFWQKGLDVISDFIDELE